MMSISLLSNKLTDTILLPQPTTLYPIDFRYFATLSTSKDSFLPNVKNYTLFLFYLLTLLSPNLFPQPLKSKQAIPIYAGNMSKNSFAYNLDDEFPCRYKITYFGILFLGKYSDISISST